MAVLSAPIEMSRVQQLRTLQENVLTQADELEDRAEGIIQLLDFLEG